MMWRTVRGFVVHNLHMKVVALALAALMWSAVANEPAVEVAFQSPLEFRNMPDELELSSEVPTSVRVRVRGPASAVRQLTSADLAVTLNLEGFERPGERSYPLTISDVRIPFGVDVTQIVPAQVQVRFEAQSRRDVPVVPRIVGTYAPGYHLASYQVYPPTVTVIGPESHVRVIESATTDPIDVTGIIARVQVRTNVLVADPMVRIQQNDSVRVTIQMTKR